jgi:hypothetical protein
MGMSTGSRRGSRGREGCPGLVSMAHSVAGSHLEPYKHHRFGIGVTICQSSFRARELLVTLFGWFEGLSSLDSSLMISRLLV